MHHQIQRTTAAKAIRKAGRMLAALLLATGAWSASSHRALGFDYFYGGFDVFVNGTLSVETLHYFNWQLDDVAPVYLPEGSPPTPFDYSRDPIYETLSVNGDATIDGNVSLGLISLGIWEYDSTPHTGVVIFFIDDENETSGETRFTAGSTEATWRWMQNGADTAATQMSLNAAGNLALSDHLTGNGVVLKPGNFTLSLVNDGAVASNVSLGSVSVTQPSTTFSEEGILSLDDGNLTIQGTSPSVNFGALPIAGSLGWVLFGDSVGFGPSQVSVNVNTNSGLEIWNPGPYLAIFMEGSGLGIGSSTYANTSSNSEAIAIGNHSNAAGLKAVALGNSTASDDYSLTVGNLSLASGGNATAIGGGNATAVHAIAIGSGTISQTWGTVVIGRNNVAIAGNATTWQAADPAFIVGIGENAAARRNGLVVYNNGTVALNGAASLLHPSYVSPTHATQPQELQVLGTATFNGNVTFAGNFTVAPQGDIPMGQFDGSNAY